MTLPAIEAAARMITGWDLLDCNSAEDAVREILPVLQPYIERAARQHERKRALRIARDHAGYVTYKRIKGALIEDPSDG